MECFNNTFLNINCKIKFIIKRLKTVQRTAKCVNVISHIKHTSLPKDSNCTRVAKTKVNNNVLLDRLEPFMLVVANKSNNVVSL